MSNALRILRGVLIRHLAAALAAGFSAAAMSALSSAIRCRERRLAAVRWPARPRRPRPISERRTLEVVRRRRSAVSVAMRAEEARGEYRVLGELALEQGRAERQHGAGLDGPHAGRYRLAVEPGDLADDLAGAELADLDLAGRANT